MVVDAAVNATAADAAAALGAVASPPQQGGSVAGEATEPARPGPAADADAYVSIIASPAAVGVHKAVTAAKLQAADGSAEWAAQLPAFQHLAPLSDQLAGLQLETAFIDEEEVRSGGSRSFSLCLPTAEPHLACAPAGSDAPW